MRLRNCQESVLRFLHQSEVHVTNNWVEQDLRKRTVRQKISGGFRSAQDCATPRCALSSARKQGRNCLDALPQGPEVLFAALPP